MALSHETLKAMIRDYQGFPLSDDELELIRPELDNYLQAIEGGTNQLQRDTVRRLAEALELGAKEQAPRVVELLKDSDRRVRLAAARAQ